MGECLQPTSPEAPPAPGAELTDALTDCNGNPSLRVTLCKDDEFVTACAQDDGRIILVQYTTDEAGVITTVVREIDGTISAAIPVVCPSKTIEMAPSQIVCVDGVEFTQVPVMDFAVPSSPVQVATLWYNAVGALVADPTVGASVVSLGECVTGVFVPHENGCIERTTVGAPLVCQSSASTFTFDANDFIQFTVLANDGNGNYTILQEMTPAGQAMLLSVLTLLGQDNTRAVEDVGGLFQSYFWEGNFDNVVVVSPTELQFDAHFEPGVTDIPDALIVPCVDPVSDATYQSSAAFISSIYNAATVGVPEPQGGLVVTFDVTQYSQSGTETVEHIPAKQIVKDTSSGLVDTYYEPGTMNPIVFNPLTDVFYSTCPDTPIAVDAPVCGGTTTVSVDSTVAAYVMNEKHEHTETLYDNVTATLGGTVTTVVAGTNVSFDFTGVVATNWVGANYVAEFGNGFSDVGGNPSFDYVNEPDGNYEIKIYRSFVYPEGIRWYVFAAVEIIKTGSTITVTLANPQPVNRSVTYSQKSVFQDYCGSTPVGSPYLADGSPATINGTLSVTERQVLSEWLGVHDANNTASSAVPLALKSGGVSIANGVYTAALGPDGTVWNTPANLKSVTVRARQGTSLDAVPGGPIVDQVIVQTATNKVVLLKDETFTWYVADENDLSLLWIECFGDSAALVVWVEG